MSHNIPLNPDEMCAIWTNGRLDWYNMLTIAFSWNIRASNPQMDSVCRRIVHTNTMSTNARSVA